MGYTPDISVLLQFQFYEPVYYKVLEVGKWGESNEALGRFVGFADNIGHAMTFKIRPHRGRSCDCQVRCKDSSKAGS
jgi:hypothetical protein